MVHSTLLQWVWREVILQETALVHILRHQFLNTMNPCVSVVERITWSWSFISFLILGSLLISMSSNSPLLSSNSNSSDNDQHDDMDFEIEDYLNFNEDDEENGCALPSPELHWKPLLQAKTAPVHATYTLNPTKGLVKKKASEGGRMKMAFMTKSEHEILDDGYKWRKYGKKMVKDSPNPRNYYRCSYEGCDVKKRVERHRDDPSYVITTYEGVHNHLAPSASTAEQIQGSYSLPVHGFST